MNLMLISEIFLYLGLILMGVGEVVGFLMMDGIYPSSSERQAILSLIKYSVICIILAIVMSVIAKIFL